MIWHYTWPDMWNQLKLSTLKGKRQWRKGEIFLSSWLPESLPKLINPGLKPWPQNQIQFYSFDAVWIASSSVYSLFFWKSSSAGRSHGKISRMSPDPPDLTSLLLRCRQQTELKKFDCSLFLTSLQFLFKNRGFRMNDLKLSHSLKGTAFPLLLLISQSFQIPARETKKRSGFSFPPSHSKLTLSYGFYPWNVSWIFLSLIPH